jgi:TolB-like protein
LAYRIGDYHLDPLCRELRFGQTLRRLEPQVFDTLVFLVENRARVVSKDDLVAAVWNGRFVSDATVESRIKAARRAVGDDGRSQRIIRTIPRRGFRFVAEVEGVDGHAGKPALVLPEKPSIAVLPFQNLSGDPGREYFADGISDDIITTLSRIPNSVVIARSSSFSYKGRSVDVRQIGRELGVRYVVDGSVQQAAGKSLRISCVLIDAGSGTHLWAERYDGSLDDLFELQDRITSSIVATVLPKVLRTEIARAQAKPTSSLSAYDLYLRAMG